MAADTGLWLGPIGSGYTEKIKRLPDGRLFAASGETAVAEACCAWLEGEAKQPEPEDGGSFRGLVLSRDGVWQVDHKFRLTRTCDVTAAGAHTEFLLGALYAGASAEQAVRLAIEYGDSARGEVQVVAL